MSLVISMDQVSDQAINAEKAGSEPLLFSPAHDIKSWRVYFYTMLSILISQEFFLMVHSWLIISLYNLGLLADQKRPENILWLW